MICDKYRERMMSKPWKTSKFNNLTNTPLIEKAKGRAFAHLKIKLGQKVTKSKKTRKHGHSPELPSTKLTKR